MSLLELLVLLGFFGTIGVSDMTSPGPYDPPEPPAYAEDQGGYDDDMTGGMGDDMAGGAGDDMTGDDTAGAPQWIETVPPAPTSPGGDLLHVELMEDDSTCELVLAPSTGAAGFYELRVQVMNIQGRSVTESLLLPSDSWQAMQAGEQVRFMVQSTCEMLSERLAGMEQAD